MDTTMTAPVQLHNLVAGQWLPGAGVPLHSINPANPRLIVAEGRSAETCQLEAAVAAAADAQAAWAATPIHQRGAVLMEAAAVVERNAAAWGFELAAEEGKTKAEGIGEVRRAAQILRYYGNEGDRQTGEIFSSPRAGEQILVTRKPVGVVGVITPFNFPIAIPAWKIAPALVYGNTVVWKPASAVPLLAMRLAQALTCAGLPACVVLIVTGAVVTASGPHPGSSADVHRLSYWNDSIYVHVRVAAAFGIGVLIVGWLLWRIREAYPGLIGIWSGLLVVLVAQAIVGEVQYRNGLPWGIVLVHVALAASIWAFSLGLAYVLWRPPVPLTRK